MANLFYGVCDSDQAADVKIIHRPPAEADTDIEEGDLLVVYFAHGNTVASPQLSIDNLSDNQGLVVKKRDIQEDVSYMWKAGEVVGFVLVSQQANTDNNVSTEEGATSYETANNALYWELFESGRATKEWYGMTKLFDVQDTMPPETWPNDVAATPALVEWVYNQIPKKEGRTITGIEYLTDWEGKQGNQQGKLVINYDTGNPDEYVITDNDTTYTNTSEFYNDANGNGAAGTNTDDGTYYITNVLRGNLYLNGGIYGNVTPNLSKGIAVPDGITLRVGPGYDIIVAKGATITGNSLAQTGTITATGAMSEFNTPLTQRYSPLLEVSSYSTNCYKFGPDSQIQKGYTSNSEPGSVVVNPTINGAHIKETVEKSGYYPVGIIGYNISYKSGYSTSGKDSAMLNLWECYISDRAVGSCSVNFAMYNPSTKYDRAGWIKFHILWKKVFNDQQ